MFRLNPPETAHPKSPHGRLARKHLHMPCGNFQRCLRFLAFPAQQLQFGEATSRVLGVKKCSRGSPKTHLKFPQLIFILSYCKVVGNLQENVHFLVVNSSKCVQWLREEHAGN